MRRQNQRTSPRRSRAVARCQGRVATLRIRRATLRDVPAILSLIRGLAAYEKLAHEVRATARRLARDGFGRQRRFRALLAIRVQERRRAGRAAERLREAGRNQPRGANHVVGFALFFFAYSTFLARPTLFLEDLYVLPEERGGGAGKMLLRALAALAVRAECGRMDWLVLADNTPAIRIAARLREAPAARSNGSARNFTRTGCLRVFQACRCGSWREDGSTRVRGHSRDAASGVR